MNTDDPHFHLAVDLIAGDTPPEGEVFTTAPGLRVGQSKRADHLRRVCDDDGEYIDLLLPGAFGSALELAKHLKRLNPTETTPTGRGWE